MSDPEPTRDRTVVHRSGELLGGQRPGNQRLRVTQPEAVDIPVRVRTAPKPTLHPGLVFVYGFAGLILIGTLLLSLPFATAEGMRAPLLTALFTATSAVCVTGLVVVDTGTYWSFFGQSVILLLVQLGGFGFMTSSALLFIIIGRQITLRERVLTSSALGTRGLETTMQVVRGAFFLTLAAEGVGAILLTGLFLQHMEPLQAGWWGVFHAISAFNNAGFDVTGGFQSMIGFSHQPLVLLVVATLVTIGGVSFAVVADVARRGFRRWSLDTKLVVLSYAALAGLGTVGLLFTEIANEATLGGMAAAPRLLNAFFAATASRTAGFTSVDVGSYSEEGLLVLMPLMFIGGGAASTAGGIKVQTFSLLLFAIISAIRGAPEVEAFRRRVPVTTVLRAIAVALLSLALVFLFTFMLSVSEDANLMRILFEAFSGFGTVGLSTGITPTLSVAGQLILVVAMFVGRLGPLTLVLALAARERRPTYRWLEEGVKIG